MVSVVGSDLPAVITTEFLRRAVSTIFLKALSGTSLVLKKSHLVRNVS